MAWTSPRTWSIGEKITAAIMNTHIRDNLAYLKGLLDGTGSGTVTFPGNVTLSNDANFRIEKVGSVISYNMDTGDGYQFDRTANAYNWVTASAVVLSLAASGKLTGAGFYDSGDVTVTNGSTQSFTHGLAAQPRFYSGQHNAGSGVARFPVAYVGAGGTTVAFVAVDSANVQIINNSGGSRQVRACAML